MGPLRRDGERIVLRIGDDERAALSTAFEQMRMLLVEGEDPNLTRLFPPAYPDDEAREVEYRGLVRDELLARKLDAIDLVEAALDAGELADDEALLTWMGALNDLRLVIGTRLDVDVNDTGPAAPEDEYAWAVYQYLSHLLEASVELAPR